jgi:hypothetical protein
VAYETTGGQVRNATRGGRLETFPRVDFDALLGRATAAAVAPPVAGVMAGAGEDGSLAVADPDAVVPKAPRGKGKGGKGG